jgi:signal peptidase II
MLRFGLGVAVAAALLDRVSKWVLLDLWPPPAGGLRLTPFFNLVMAWNRGVSFGLFDADWPGLPWLLSALALAIVAGLVLWLRKAEGPWLAAALGLIIGGALSNVVDRLVFGAVADFFDFHLAGYHWPAFNMADTAIVVGVGILLFDALFAGPERTKKRE